MTIEDDNSRLGHDPLEWLQEDDSDEPNAEVEAPKSVVEQPPKPETAEGPEAEIVSAAEPKMSEIPEAPPEPEAEVELAQDVEVEVNASEPPAESSSLQIDNHKAAIVLPERLTVHVVETLHSEWKVLFYDIPQHLEISAQDVHDIDAAGMQLLYIMVQQLAFKGCDIEITGVHHNLQRNFNLVGLNDFFANYIVAA